MNKTITITKEELMDISADVVAKFIHAGLECAETDRDIERVALLAEGVMLTHARLIDRLFNVDEQEEETV